MVNYRLDIAAKELEKWDQGLTANKNKDQVTKEVEELFK